MGTGATDDYYALLGVEAGSDAATLRRAWRLLALKWHPDRAGAESTGRFAKISAAYAVLSDPAARAAYDRRRGIAPRPDVRSSPVRRAPGNMLDRLSGPLRSLLMCGFARWTAGQVLELFLNAMEAEQGGMITIAMRVAVRCQACDGTGPCEPCGATRTVEELFSAWLAVPPDVVDGTILHPSALLPGMVAPPSFRIRLLGF